MTTYTMKLGDTLLTKRGIPVRVRSINRRSREVDVDFLDGVLKGNTISVKFSIIEREYLYRMPNGTTITPNIGTTPTLTIPLNSYEYQRDPFQETDTDQIAKYLLTCRNGDERDGYAYIGMNNIGVTTSVSKRVRTTRIGTNSPGPMIKWAVTDEVLDTGFSFYVSGKWRGSKDGWILLAVVTHHIVGDKKGTTGIRSLSQHKLRSLCEKRKWEDARWKIPQEDVHEEQYQDVLRLSCCVSWLYDRIFISQVLPSTVTVSLWSHPSDRDKDYITYSAGTPKKNKLRNNRGKR